MSNLNSNESTNDFEEIFVDTIKGHDTPGYLLVEQGATFPKGIAVGTNIANPGQLGALLVSDDGLQSGQPTLHIISNVLMTEKGSGEYFDVQVAGGNPLAGVNKIFRIRPINGSNAQNFLVDIPDADYGEQGAPVLHIGGNTNDSVMGKANNSRIPTEGRTLARYPGALRLDTQVAEHAITIFASFGGNRDTDRVQRGRLSTTSGSRAVPTGFTRIVPRLLYRGDAGYVHGDDTLMQIGRRKGANFAIENRGENEFVVALLNPSFSRSKDITGEATPQDEALGYIVELSKHLRQFRYKSSAENAPVSNGIILDDAPGRYIDGDRETQTGSINELTLFGDLVASVALLSERMDEQSANTALLNDRLTAERERNDKLEQQITALTARLEALEDA